MRQRLRVALDFVLARPPLAQASGGTRLSFPGRVALSSELGISRSERTGLVALTFQRVEFALQFGEPVVEARAL